MRSIKIVKRGASEPLNPSSAEGEDHNNGRENTREIVKTVRSWIADLQARRRADGLALKRFRATVSLLILLFFGMRTESSGQELRDAFRKVDQAVVVIRTSHKELAPFPQQGMVSLSGLGSGVLISNDGKVLTAAHLVQSADATLVEFSNGEAIPAQVTGLTFSADVALLQLARPPSKSAAAALGNSDALEIGDQIFVVGAPYGLSRTLTAGHISGRHTLNKRTENATVVEMLQTDAAINTGSSGSPVFNLNGEVVGIISNIVSRSGGSEGVAFAATSNTARRLLLEQRPFWSGIEGFLLDGDLARALNLPQSAGLLVQRVAEGSIAWRWGIHAGKLRANVAGEDLILGGDIILAMNEVSLAEGGNYDELHFSIGKLRTGDLLSIKVLRQGQILALSVPLE